MNAIERARQAALQDLWLDFKIAQAEILDFYHGVKGDCCEMVLAEEYGYYLDSKDYLNNYYDMKGGVQK